MSDRPCRLFIYGTLLPGERDHALLAAAELLSEVTTEPLFQLVDLGMYAALIPDGKVAIHGLLYAADLGTRRAIDVRCQVPILFQRITVPLTGGTSAEAYAMMADQTRGKRRLAHGDWLKRFQPALPHRAGGPLVQWAKGRHSK